jgi:Tol biopolymer transport system component
MSGGRAGGPVVFAAVAAMLLAALVALAPLVAHAAEGDVTLVSSGGVGTPAADGDSGPGIAASASGRFVAFESRATNLSPAAQPGVVNIYLHDRTNGTTTLISRASGADGVGADADATNPAISPAGRYVAFQSTATNLSPDDAHSGRDYSDIFVRDTMTNTTTVASRAADGAPADGDSWNPSISAYGTYVAFDSVAPNLSTEDDDQFRNVYRKNMETGAVDVVSKPFGGVGDGNSYDPTIDTQGRYVAYTSDADNLSTKDDNAFTNVFVSDMQFGYAIAVSLPSGTFLSQDPSNGNSFDGVVSGDGRYVAFVSYAQNLVSDTPLVPGVANVFRRDIQATKTDLVSRANGAGGAAGTADSTHPSISQDGRFVAFESAASLSGLDGGGTDIFERGVADGTTALVSRTQGSGPAADAASYAPSLAMDARFVAFSSDANNLSTDDDDEVRNVFERQVPVTPPPPDAPPDLGTNDHSAHEGHTAAEHAGHTAAEHAGHISPTGGPAMTLFGPPIQDVDRLFMLATLHDDGTLIVSGSVAVKVRGKASRVYRFRGFSGKVPAHREYRVKLKLSKSKLRVVKRALKRHRRLTAKIVGQAQSAAGGPWTTVTRTVRLTN